MDEDVWNQSFCESSRVEKTLLSDFIKFKGLMQWKRLESRLEFACGVLRNVL